MRRATVRSPGSSVTILAVALALALSVFQPGPPALAQGGGPESNLPEVDGWAVTAPLPAPVSE